MNKYLFITFETPDKEAIISLKSQDDTDHMVIDIEGKKVVVEMSELGKGMEAIKKFNNEK